MPAQLLLERSMAPRAGPRRTRPRHGRAGPTSSSGASCARRFEQVRRRQPRLQRRARQRVGDERVAGASAAAFSIAATAGARSSSVALREREHLPHPRVARMRARAGLGRAAGPPPPAPLQRGEPSAVDRVGVGGIGSPEQPRRLGVHSPSASPMSVAAITAATASRSVRRQIGMPGVDDQDDAQLVAGVHRLMLDRVVEHPGLAGFPFARLGADPEPAARRHDQRQMADQAGIGDADCAAGYARRGASSENIALGPRRGSRGWSSSAEQGHRRRAMAGIGLDRQAVPDEVDGGPGAGCG